MFVLVCLSGLGQVQGAVERRPGQINSPSFANESEWTTAVSIAFYASRYHRSLENIYMHISKKKKRQKTEANCFQVYGLKPQICVDLIMSSLYFLT